jgi:hypothetical protein
MENLMKQFTKQIWLLGFWLCMAVTAWAQPANDNLSQAVAIRSLPFEMVLETASATVENAEAKPSCNDTAGASVWWKLTATANGFVKINSADSDYDTVLSVWTGENHPLTEVACNDDASEVTTSAVGFSAEAGKTYYIQLSGYDAATGNIKLKALMVEPARNKGIATATMVNSLPYEVETMNADGGLDAGEAAPSCKPEDEKGEGNSIWWSYTPTQDGMVRIETKGSDIDTIISVWTGASHPLNEVGCNDDGEGTTSKLNLEVKGGTKYLIRVSGYESAVGNIALKIREIHPPKNDHLANAIAITTVPYETVGSTEGATKEESEEGATCGSEDNNSIWWKYTATQDGVLTANTFGTEYDTILSVSESTGFATTEVACNDDAGEGNASRVAVMVQKGKTYYIRASGYSGAEGELKLAVNFGQPPANGILSKAIAVAVLPSRLTGNNRNAPSEKDETKASCGSDGMNAIWWKYTPAKDVVLLIDPSESSFSPIVTVSSGSEHPLTELGCYVKSEEEESKQPKELGIGLAGGETYFIRVSGKNAEEGDVKLALRAGIPPKNGKVANSTPILTFPYQATSNNLGAIAEKDLTALSCGSDVKNSIWWKYTARENGLLKVTTEGTTFDTVMGIWTGTGKPETEIACNDDAGTPSGGDEATPAPSVGDEATTVDAATESTQYSVARALVETGKTYYIQVAGYQNSTGDVKLKATLGKPNAKSLLKNAAAILSLPFEAKGNNVDAVPESDAAKPSCKENATNPIWWKYTAKETGAILINTVGSSFDTNLSVWSGETHPLTEVACNDDGLEESKSQVVFDTEVGKTYYIRVDGNNNAEGDVVLIGKKVVPPSNASLEKAVAISSLPFEATGISTLGGGMDMGEEKASCGGEKDGSSIWYKYKAAKNGFVVLDVAPTGFDVVASAWQGSSHPLTEKGCIDAATSGDKESLAVAVMAGETYYLRISGYDSAAGEVSVSLKEAIPAANDNLGNAELIRSLPYNKEMIEWFSSMETDEGSASCSSEDKNSLWWKYVSPTNKAVNISTVGSDFDTVISVWTGDKFPLSEAGCNDDAEGATNSEAGLTFDAKAGTVYYIRINGYSGKSGKLVIKAE